jgi:hypothetical protein
MGQDGAPGQLGRLTLINQTDPVLPDNPSTTIRLGQFAQQPVNLSKNRWDLRRGAAALLAPGSIIADEYREFAGRLEQSVQLDWQVDRPLSEVGNESIGLELQDNRQVSVTVPEEVWLVGDTTVAENVTTYTVTELVRRSEATQLEVGNFAGSGATLELSVVDLAGRSDVVSTQFEIEYRSTDDPFGDRGRYTTRYEGPVPAEAVTQSFNRFTIDLSQLPIESRFRQSGIRVDIELTAIRSLGGRSAEQEIDFRDRI